MEIKPLQSLDSSVIELLTNWRERCFRHQHAHAACASIFAARHYLIGIPLVVLTALAAARWPEGADSTWVKWLVSLASLSAAILAAVQTFLLNSERAEKHRTASAAYLSLRRRIGQFLLIPTEKQALEESINDIRERLDLLDQDAPTVLNKVWKRLDATLEMKKTGIAEQALFEQTEK
ncbi:MAG: DUF4231 domain-containing protein [Planctomycetota bacterium]